MPLDEWPIDMAHDGSRDCWNQLGTEGKLFLAKTFALILDVEAREDSDDDMDSG